MEALLHAGTMTAEEEARHFAEMDSVGEALTRLIRRHPFLARLVRSAASSGLGGRALFHAFLQPLASNCLSLMAENDRCGHACTVLQPVLLIAGATGTIGAAHRSQPTGEMFQIQHCCLGLTCIAGFDMLRKGTEGTLRNAEGAALFFK